jgi:hypothetical protein
VQHSGMYLVANYFQCSNSATNGQFLQVTQERGACTIFKPKPVTYRFATTQMGLVEWFGNWIGKDNWYLGGNTPTNYCVGGYRLDGPTNALTYRNLSVAAQPTKGPYNPNYYNVGRPLVQHGNIEYGGQAGGVGQVLLYCNPK